MATVRWGVGVMARSGSGILQGISHCLRELDCNIEDLVSSVLHGNLGLMLVCEAPEEISRDSMRTALKAAMKGLPVLLVDVWAVDESIPQPHPNYSLAVFGPDQHGVVHRIVAFLDEQGITYSDVVCGRFRADSPFARCICTFELDLPADIAVDELKTELRLVGKEVELDVVLVPIE